MINKYIFVLNFPYINCVTVVSLFLPKYLFNYFLKNFSLGILGHSTTSFSSVIHSRD